MIRVCTSLLLQDGSPIDVFFICAALELFRTVLCRCEFHG